jgi:hypothetical protein
MATKKSSKGFVPPKGMPQLKPAGKPTEAIVAPGQKAKGLGKSTKDNRFASNAKTPVKKAGSGFAGSGGTTASGFKDITKGDIVNAALAVTALPGSGQVKAAIAKTVGKRAGALADKAAFNVLSAPLEKATGMGGKVAKTFTPFGPSLRSTKVGSAAEQSARIGNLMKGADKSSTMIGRQAASDAIRGAVKGMNKAGKVVRDSATIYVGNKAAPKKKKK